MSNACNENKFPLKHTEHISHTTLHTHYTLRDTQRSHKHNLIFWGRAFFFYFLFSIFVVRFFRFARGVLLHTVLRTIAWRLYVPQRTVHRPHGLSGVRGRAGPRSPPVGSRVGPGYSTVPALAEHTLCTHCPAPGADVPCMQTVETVSTVRIVRTRKTP